MTNRAELVVTLVQIASLACWYAAMRPKLARHDPDPAAPGTDVSYQLDILAQALGAR